MGISRMMSQQVQQSEETVQTLGTDVIWVLGYGLDDSSTFLHFC